MGNGVNKLLSGGDLMKNQWRSLTWDEQTRHQLIETIKEYKPLSQVDVQYAKILLLGHVNVGKSSYFNTTNSIFRNHVTAQAPVGSPRDQRSITTKMRGYQVRHGREGKVLSFKIVDTMGLEEEKRKGFEPSELSYILDGHVPDNHQFDPSGNISAEMPGFIKVPKLQDKVHCCVFVLDANAITTMSDALLGKLSDMRTKITARGIPLIVLVTKIDKACNSISQDVSLVYRSTALQHLLALASTKIGVPVSHVLPIKNYTHEIELDPWVDILALSALQQMLRFTDNYFDECLVQTGKGYIQPEKLSNDAWTRNTTSRMNGQVKQAWSSSITATPTAIAGRLPAASVQSTPIGRGILGGNLGTPAATKLHSPEKRVEPQVVEEVEEEFIDADNNQIEKKNEELAGSPMKGADPIAPSPNGAALVQSAA